MSLRLSVPFKNEAIRFASLTTRLILLFAFLFTLVEISSYRNITLVPYVLFGFGIAILILKIKWGILYYLTVNLLSTDTPYTYLTTGFSSVHTTQIAGMTIMSLWTLLVLFWSVCHIMQKMRTKVFLSHIDKLMLIMGLLFGIEAVLGLRHSNINLSVFISDFSYFINMGIAYLAVRLTCRDKHSLYVLLALVVACLIVRACAGIIYFFVGIGEMAGANVRAVTDSIRNIFPLLILLNIAYFVRYPFSKDHVVRRLFMLGGIIGMFNLISYASRGNIVMTFIGFIILMLLSRNYKSPRRHLSFPFKSFFKIVIPVIILLSLTLWSMETIRPGSSRYVSWKLHSLTMINSKGDKISSAATRWLEFKNIVPYLWDRGSIIWGEGLGGWFTDEYYPFAASLLGGSAFKDEWILQGRLYKPHGTQLFILLKMGVGGLVVYYSILFMIFIKGIKVSRICNDPLLRIFLLGIISFLPLLFYKNFISKMQVFMGILIGIIAVVQKLYSVEHLRTRN